MVCSNVSSIARRELLRRCRARRGFTLIEAGFVTVVIGLCTVATLQLMAVGTVSNDQSAEMTVAVNLANNVRDIMVGLPLYDPQNPTQFISREASVALYDNVTDFDSQTYSPPLDSNRLALTNYPTWSQQIVVQSVGEDDLSTTKTSSAAENAARVTVTITHGGKAVYRTGWVVANTTGG